jgi:hypothetical protein
LTNARKMLGYAMSNGPKASKERVARTLAEEVLSIGNANASAISVDHSEAPTQMSAVGVITVDIRGRSTQVPVYKIAVRMRATTLDDDAIVKVFLGGGDTMFHHMENVFVAEHVGPTSYKAHLFQLEDAPCLPDATYDLARREDCRSVLRQGLCQCVEAVSDQQRTGSWCLCRKGHFTATTAETFVKHTFSTGAAALVEVLMNTDPLNTPFAPAHYNALARDDVAKTVRVNARAVVNACMSVPRC